MGKVILCSGQLTDTPFVFAMSNTSVYSIEEMSYYLYTHIYEIDNKFLDKSLLNWIRFELGMPELYEKLEAMRENGNDLKDIIVTILCSNDYYSEKEIKELILIMDAIKGLPTIKRRKIRGDYFLKYGMYYNATIEYEGIINDQDVSEFTPEEYGDLLHNMGVVKIYTSSYEAAAFCFKEAYNLNHKQVSLTQYMLAVLLSGNEELYNAELEKYELDEQFTKLLYEAISEKEKEAKTSKMYQTVKTMEKVLQSGNKQLYDMKLENTLFEIKQAYRKSIEG